MNFKSVKRFASGLTLVLIALTPFDSVNAKERDWAVTIYAGGLIDATLSETAKGGFSFEDACFVSIGLMRKLYTYRHYVDFEVEGQVDKFIGNQDYWQFDLLGYLRWLPFPWDKHLNTSFAVGAGLSYATDVPEIEVKNQGESRRLLGALSFEFTFALPRIPQWRLVAGLLHHRSGAGGTFGGVTSASNGFGIGMRYRF
jgi:hypothetical protein